MNLKSPSGTSNYPNARSEALVVKARESRKCMHAHNASIAQLRDKTNDSLAKDRYAIRIR